MHRTGLPSRQRSGNIFPLTLPSTFSSRASGESLSAQLSFDSITSLWVARSSMILATTSRIRLACPVAQQRPCNANQLGLQSQPLSEPGYAICLPEHTATPSLFDHAISTYATPEHYVPGCVKSDQTAAILAKVNADNPDVLHVTSPMSPIRLEERGGPFARIEPALRKKPRHFLGVRLAVMTMSSADRERRATVSKQWISVPALSSWYRDQSVLRPLPSQP
jgi:hypothetical protein